MTNPTKNQFFTDKTLEQIGKHTGEGVSLDTYYWQDAQEDHSAGTYQLFSVARPGTIYRIRAKFLTAPTTTGFTFAFKKQAVGAALGTNTALNTTTLDLTDTGNGADNTWYEATLDSAVATVVKGDYIVVTTVDESGTPAGEKWACVEMDVVPDRQVVEHKYA